MGGNLIKEGLEGKRDGDAGKVVTVEGVQDW